MKEKKAERKKRQMQEQDNSSAEDRGSKEQRLHNQFKYMHVGAQSVNPRYGRSRNLDNGWSINDQQEIQALWRLSQLPTLHNSE